MIALYIILAMVILAAALILTIWAYLLLRKHFSRNKVLNEVIAITAAILISFVAKAIVVAQVSGCGGFKDGISAGWYVLYSTIGGLSFEGIDMVNDLPISPILQCFYYGSAIYAAITSLTIITVGVSYEFYSYVKLLIIPRVYKAVYIFTDDSQESLLMAKSIAAAEKKKGRRTPVIFMGNELEAFDRKNEVHREIMNYGFYYWSYGKNHNSERESSLIKKIKYTKFFCSKKNKGDSRNKLVHIFSLKSDQNMYAAENLNSSLLFADITAVLNNYYKQGKGYKIPTIINYYVMTQSDVNYEFYSTTLTETIKNHMQKHGVTDGETYNMLVRAFQLHILSEAQLYADDLSKQLLAQATGKGYNEPLTDEEILKYRKLLECDNDGFYRTAVYGFGKTGQHALSELFIATSSFCGDGPSKFLADVYDANMREISGEFCYNHPLFCCVNSYDSPAPADNKSLYAQGSEEDGEAFMSLYTKLDPALIKQGETAKQAAFRLMGYPVIAMHESSCFEMDFMKEADSHTASIFDKSTVSYRSFVISMGNDEANLLMANLLIDDFRHELLLNKSKSTGSAIIIFVHIRDEKNALRLNWSAKDRQFFGEDLVVVSFGCRSTIWSYENIVDDERDSIFNYGYRLINGKNLQGEEPELKSMLETFEQYYDKGKTDKSYSEKALELKYKIVQKIRSSGRHKDSWLNAGAFARESNRSAARFAVNYRMAKPPFPDEYYARTEHLRWTRFHMVNGWIYADYTEEEKGIRRHCKQHNCLCPYEMITTQANDYNNIKIARLTCPSVPAEK